MTRLLFITADEHISFVHCGVNFSVDIISAFTEFIQASTCTTLIALLAVFSDTYERALMAIKNSDEFQCVARRCIYVPCVHVAHLYSAVTCHDTTCNCCCCKFRFSSTFACACHSGATQCS